MVCYTYHDKNGEKAPQRKKVKLGSCGLYPFGISRLSHESYVITSRLGAGKRKDMCDN